MTMKPREFVVRNDLNLRNCVYTVAPVMNGRIMDLPYHMKRLEYNQRLKCDMASLLLPPLVYGLILKAILSVFRSSSGTRDGLLTICLGQNNENLEWEADALLFPQSSDFLFHSANQKLVVDVQNYQRIGDPRIKACSWPQERKPLEAQRLSQAAETILCKQHQDKRNLLELTEGLTSNLFVVENGALVTAPDDQALPGSMARLVVSYANQLNAPIERRCPTLNTVDSGPHSSWSAAFLTSKMCYLCVT
jgi:branched-subunit amino acid aminotransferase/4-amino-4-deoxychorismate lyase